MDHYYISYEKFLSLANKLFDEIGISGLEYQAVLCPLRGGFYLSDFMSRKLDIPIRYLEISSYTGKERREFNVGHVPLLDKGPFILCDDIYDSGNTIRKIRDIFKDIDIDIAVLVSKKQIEHIYYGEFVADNRWVDFFWEVV